MMKHIEKIGNIDVFAERNAERDYTITFINGSGIIAQEIYFTNDIQAAIDDLFAKVLDTYTLKWLLGNIPIMELDQLSQHTYRTGEKDYFCRIDNTRFFKHYCKSADEFITNKNGLRIIDR